MIFIHSTTFPVVSIVMNEIDITEKFEWLGYPMGLSLRVSRLKIF